MRAHHSVAELRLVILDTYFNREQLGYQKMRGVRRKAQECHEAVTAEL